MKSKLPVPTAKEINDAHRMARSSAETAVQHAIRCGQMIAVKKAQLDRGTFNDWVETHCDFGRATAYNYMKHAKSSNALDGSAVRHLFPSGQKPPKKQVDTSARPDKSAPAADAEKAKPKAAAVDLPKSEQLAAAKKKPEKPAAPEINLDEKWQPDADEEAAHEVMEKEYQASIDRVMEADDKISAAHKEIKRQAAEIAILKLSRDGYMNERIEAIQLCKKLQRENDRLKQRSNGEARQHRNGSAHAA